VFGISDPMTDFYVVVVFHFFVTSTLSQKPAIANGSGKARGVSVLPLGHQTEHISPQYFLK